MKIFYENVPDNLDGYLILPLYNDKSDNYDIIVNLRHVAIFSVKDLLEVAHVDLDYSHYEADDTFIIVHYFDGVKIKVDPQNLAVVLLKEVLNV